MDVFKYSYQKDFSYLTPKKKKYFKKDLFLIALGIILGTSFTGYSRVRFSSHLVTPLAAQTSNIQNNNVIPTPTPIIVQAPTEIPTTIPSPIPTSIPTLEIKQSPTPTIVKIMRKNNYKIALLGDSMFDTAGKGYPDLAVDLKNTLPDINFNILNYGVGARDLEYGLFRLTNDYEYLGEKIPSLLSQNPDIIIVESFAYNHWANTKNDLDRQWLTLSKIIDTIKNNSSAKIVFLSTIAPNSDVYGQGIKDITWSDQERRENSETVKAYLENHIKFAQSEIIPIIDVYHQTIGQNNEGEITYINHGDFLHPSPEGHKFVASQITKWLLGNL